MLPNCALPRLYGLSLLGTPLCVYCGDKATGEVTPHFDGRPDVDRILPPDFLEGQWDLDILSPEGLRKLLRISRWKPLEFEGYLNDPFLSMTRRFFPTVITGGVYLLNEGPFGNSSFKIGPSDLVPVLELELPDAPEATVPSIVAVVLFLPFLGRINHK